MALLLQGRECINTKNDEKILDCPAGCGAFATAAFAGGDEVPVRMHELPDAAKTLVKKYFHDIEVVSATMEKGVAPSYEVKLADGTEIDFDARGEWTDVERPGVSCRTG